MRLRYTLIHANNAECLSGQDEVDYNSYLNLLASVGLVRYNRIRNSNIPVYSWKWSSLNPSEFSVYPVYCSNKSHEVDNSLTRSSSLSYTLEFK